jgi:hypothetical protein
MLPVVAIGLPALETVAGIALMFDVAGSLAIIFGLLIMFVVIIWYGILSGLNIDCGCFSPEETAGQNSLKRAFYRDLGMIAAAVYLFWVRRVRTHHELRSVEEQLNKAIEKGERE